MYPKDNIFNIYYNIGRRFHFKLSDVRGDWLVLGMKEPCIAKKVVLLLLNE